MCEYLISIGITPKKSLTIKLKETLNWDIFRGIFDGDGFVSEDRYKAQITCGSPEMVEDLKQFLISEGFVPIVRCKDKKCRCWDVQITGANQIKLLFERMYDNCGDLKLTRKYTRFVGLLARREKNIKFLHKL